MSHQIAKCTGTDKRFQQIQFKPKPFGDYDIDIKITCCGVCGSDLHTVTGGWGNKNYPIIPGHEIIGTAVKVGPKVTTVKVGDRVGVGAQISACLDCTQCKEDNETYCKKQQGKQNPRSTRPRWTQRLTAAGNRHIQLLLPRRHIRPRWLLLPHPRPRALHLPHPRRPRV